MWNALQPEGAASAAVAGLSFHLPAPKTPEPPDLPVSELIGSAARRNGVDVNLAKSIAKAESAFRADAVSSKGALGYMQVMPGTAQDMGLDPTNPIQNIEAGTKYLKFLLDRYKSSKNSLKRTIAAYNAGPGKVDKYRGVPPYRETRTYVKRVMSYYREYQRASADAELSD